MIDIIDIIHINYINKIIIYTIQKRINLLVFIFSPKGADLNLQGCKITEKINDIKLAVFSL